MTIWKRNHEWRCSISYWKNGDVPLNMLVFRGGTSVIFRSALTRVVHWHHLQVCLHHIRKDKFQSKLRQSCNLFGRVPQQKVATSWRLPLKTGPLKRDSYQWDMLQYNKPYNHLVVFHPQNQAKQPGFSSLLSLGRKDHANLRIYIVPPPQCQPLPPRKEPLLRIN